MESDPRPLRQGRAAWPEAAPGPPRPRPLPPKGPVAEGPAAPPPTGLPAAGQGTSLAGLKAWMAEREARIETALRLLSGPRRARPPAAPVPPEAPAAAVRRLRRAMAAGAKALAEDAGGRPRKGRG